MLAWITYNYLEKLARLKQYRGLKLVTFCSLLVMMGFIGAMLARSNGFPERLVVKLNASFSSTTLGLGLDGMMAPGCANSAEDEKIFIKCYHDSREEPVAAVWGDSKAWALFPGLLRNSTRHHRWMILREGVPVSSEDKIFQSYKKFNEASLRILTHDSRIKVVVIVTAARALFQLSKNAEENLEELGNSKNGPVAEAGLRRGINILMAANKAVVLIVDNPTLPPPRDCALNGRKTTLTWVNNLVDEKPNPRCNLTYTDHIKRTENYRQLITSLKSENPNLTIIDPTEILCDIRNNLCPITIDGKYLYGMTDHFSDFGSDRVATQVITLVNKILDR